jgi:hypothetical protein
MDDARRVHGEDLRVGVIQEHVEAMDVVAHVGALLRERVLDHLPEAGGGEVPPRVYADAGGDGRDFDRDLQPVAELPRLVLAGEAARVHDEPLAVHNLHVRRGRREHDLALGDLEAMLLPIDPDLFLQAKAQPGAPCQGLRHARSLSRLSAQL